MDHWDVVIGVDPHKRSSTTAALDRSGRVLGVARFPATRDGYRALRLWLAAGRPARSPSRAPAAWAGRSPSSCSVRARPSSMSRPSWLPGPAAVARPQPQDRNRKTDPDDAIATARAALHATVPRPVAAEDHTTVLRLLSERRDHLVAQRTGPSTGCTC